MISIKKKYLITFQFVVTFLNEKLKKNSFDYSLRIAENLCDFFFIFGQIVPRVIGVILMANHIDVV